MKLEVPNKAHKYNYEKLIIEWAKYEDINETSPWALFYGDNFEEFLIEIEKIKISPPNWFVKSSLFLLIYNGDIIWAIDIRHNLNHHFLKEYWGHIWYWIRPKYRRKWYATKMLKLWLIEAQKIWIKKVLLTPKITNIASNKIIQKNWWIFERKTNDWKMNRYWINT